MKSIHCILAAGLFTFAAITPLAAEHKDGILMKDGKLMTHKDGENTELLEDVTLKDGTKVTRTGDVTSADGTAWKLQEGDMIADDGTFLTHVITDGVFKKDGKIMTVKAGEKAELAAETALSDGTKVMTDGSVVSKDGKKWSLKDNDAILSDGRVLLEGSVIVKDSKPLLVKECMGETIKKEISLDGTKIRPDLAVTKKDGGGETALKNGDIVKTDGTILRAGGGTE
ncbi:hypothetical protein OKA05_19575 [Luteolibacter arcticus]|uniref:DUF6799 domain-containing protein n=1 Tax=Luteolibacter arcticus TaxID=1581411 RepID=A0ABT3GMM4_9BACT|nr:DUF6799 domain-containing protein [Luteolibacter arcticus]MCW1924775.1 hypothetical protein [Luteolibacter arcticus]